MSGASRYPWLYVQGSFGIAFGHKTKSSLPPLRHALGVCPWAVWFPVGVVVEEVAQ